MLLILKRVGVPPGCPQVTSNQGLFVHPFQDLAPWGSPSLCFRDPAVVSERVAKLTDQKPRRFDKGIIYQTRFLQPLVLLDSCLTDKHHSYLMRASALRRGFCLTDALIALVVLTGMPPFTGQLPGRPMHGLGSKIRRHTLANWADRVGKLKPQWNPTTIRRNSSSDV